MVRGLRVLTYSLRLISRTQLTSLTLPATPCSFVFLQQAPLMSNGNAILFTWKKSQSGFQLAVKKPIAKWLHRANRTMNQSDVLTNEMLVSNETNETMVEGCPILWHNKIHVLDIIKCPLTLIVNKIVTVLFCIKNRTLCDVYCEVPWISVCHSIGHVCYGSASIGK